MHLGLGKVFNRIQRKCESGATGHLADKAYKEPIIGRIRPRLAGTSQACYAELAVR